MKPSAEVNPDCPTTSLSSSSSSEEESGEDEFVDDGVPPAKKKKTEKGETREKKQKRKHPCPVCGKKFPFPNTVRLHMEVHNKTYECLECENQKFGSYNELRAHSKTFHSKAVHKCSLCSYTNSRPAFVNRHYKLNHVDGVPCTIPGCSLKVAKNRLKTHILECHSNNSVSLFSAAPTRARISWNKCPICDYTPDKLIIDVNLRHEDLMRHMKTIHENNGVIECPFKECNARVKLSLLDAHLRKEHSDSPTQTTRSSLATDNDTETLTSKTTEEFEQSDQELSDDEEYVEEGEGEPPMKQKRTFGGDAFKCKHCDSKFPILRNLRRHVKSVHTKEYAPRKETASFDCSRQSMTTPGKVCGKAFRTEQALIDHHNVHDDVKPYGCVTCNQRFQGRDRLAVHLKKYHQTSIKMLNANETEFGVSRSSVEEELFEERHSPDNRDDRLVTLTSEESTETDVVNNPIVDSDETIREDDETEELDKTLELEVAADAPTN